MPTYVFIPQENKILTNDLLNSVESHHILKDGIVGIAIDYIICPKELHHYEQFSHENIQSLHVRTVQQYINNKMTNVYITAEEYDNPTSTDPRCLKCTNFVCELIDFYYDCAKECMFGLIEGFRE